MQLSFMRANPGLGELLRHLSDLLDQGSEQRYAEMGLNYRARYTPVLRALKDGAGGGLTVSDIRDRSRLTQGAVSQTLALMEEDGLIARHALPDRRKSQVRLTAKGEGVLAVVAGHWETIFAAIDELEAEVGHPVRQVLSDTIAALERQGFAERLRAAAQESADHDV